MKLVNKHIEFSVIKSILLVVVVLLGMQIFIAFVRQLDDIGTGNYGVWQVVQYVFLMLPNNLYQFFPMAGLMGGLLGLGDLAAHRELIVMRTAGMSVKQIIWTVSKAVVILVFVVTLLGELLAPFTTNLAELKKAVAKSGGQTLNTSHGVWMRDKETFVHIQTMVPGIHLLGITQYQFNTNHRLIKVSYAKSAVFEKDQWILQNIVETSFDQKSTSKKTIGRKPWTIEINPELLSASRIEPDQMSLTKLKNFIEYRQKNGLQTSEYLLGFWQRLIQPFSNLIMIFLAIPFVLGPLRTMTMGLRILIGIIIGFSFYLLNRFFGSFCLVYQISPIIGAILPSCLFFMIGLLSMRRIR